MSVKNTVLLCAAHYVFPLLAQVIVVTVTYQMSVSDHRFVNKTES